MANSLLKRIKLLFTARGETAYADRLSNELEFYSACENVHDLPEIFHYWSNEHLLPKFLPFGFNHPEDFFLQQLSSACATGGQIRAISIGAGNCDAEVRISQQLLQQGISNFHIECLDINPSMLQRGAELAEEKGVSHHVSGVLGDFNNWKPDGKYQVVIANQSLHHVLELENLFNAIHGCMTEDGQFLVSDMIGRNGHLRWPEALETLQPFWQELPDSYRYNQLLRRQEDQYMDHDCSSESFEGVRAQDVLPLLADRFNFELFLPFGNIIFVFVDRPFGHNFDNNADWDKDFIDRVHARDEQGILSGELKPTQMTAVMCKAQVECRLSHPKLTPEFCIRDPGR
jgi:SAM-dependent methyltransferase